MSDLKEKAIKGVTWNAISRFSTKGVNFIIGLILARILSPSDYGVVGMVGIFFAIAQTFVDSGFGSALIRKNDCDDIDCSTAFFFNVIVGLLCCICLFMLSPFIADFFNTPILRDIVKVMSLNLLIGSFTIVHSARLTHSVDFKSHAKVDFLSSLISGLVGIFLAYKGLGVWSLVLQNLSSTILKVILLFLVTKWFPKKVFSIESFRYLFGFGGKILASSLLHTAYSNLTTMIIGKVYSPQDLGFYSRGQSLASFPSTNITGILQGVTFPVLSKIQDDEKHLIESYRKLISMTSLAIFFGMFLMASLAKPIILTILTDKWSNAVIYLQVFCFTYMFDHLNAMNLNILYVKGLSNLVLRLEIIKKTISISMVLAAIPLGPLAMCIAGTVYTQIAVIINTYYSGKLFGLGYFEQVKDFGKYFIFSIIAVIPAFVVTYTRLNSVLQLLFGFTSACVIYLMMIKNDIYFKKLCTLVKDYFVLRHRK